MGQDVGDLLLDLMIGFMQGALVEPAVLLLGQQEIIEVAVIHRVTVFPAAGQFNPLSVNDPALCRAHKSEGTFHMQFATRVYLDECRVPMAKGHFPRLRSSG